MMLQYFLNYFFEINDKDQNWHCNDLEDHGGPLSGHPWAGEDFWEMAKLNHLIFSNCLTIGALGTNYMKSLHFMNFGAIGMFMKCKIVKIKDNFNNIIAVFERPVDRFQILKGVA